MRERTNPSRKCARGLWSQLDRDRVEDEAKVLCEMTEKDGTKIRTIAREGG